jgi:hypothetical protein
VTLAGEEHLRALRVAFASLQARRAAADEKGDSARRASRALLTEANRRARKIDKKYDAAVAGCANATDPAACENDARIVRDAEYAELDKWFRPQEAALDATSRAATDEYWVDAPRAYADNAHAAGLQFSDSVDGCLSRPGAWRGRAGGSPSEILPDEVYVASGKDGYLTSAAAYHENWDLPVETVATIYDLLAKIGAGAPGARRIRFLTHAHPEGMYLPVFGSGGARLDIDWLKVVGGGATAVYAQLLGVDLRSAAWRDTITFVLGQLDPNSQYFADLDLGNPSDDVRRLLAATVHRTAQINYGTAPTTVFTRRFQACAAAWQQVSQLALSGQVSTASLSAFTAAVAGVSGSIRISVPAGLMTRGDVYRRWLANARGALALGDRLDVDLVNCRAACGPDTFLDLRGCRLEPETVEEMANVLGIPPTNASGSRWYMSYPPFGQLRLTSWECRDGGGDPLRTLRTLARDTRIRDAVARLGEVIGADALPAVAGGDKVDEWERLPHAERLVCMLEVWLFVAVTVAKAGGVGGYAVLDLGVNCGSLRRESLEVFLRSLWADATAERVGFAVKRWLADDRGGTRFVPVMVEDKAPGSATTLPFELRWSEQITTG